MIPGTGNSIAQLYITDKKQFQETPWFKKLKTKKSCPGRDPSLDLHMQSLQNAITA